MRIVILALVILSAQAADTPVLTVEQKLSVRETQVALVENRAAIAEAESHLRDLYLQRPVVQKAFEDARAKATPEGWLMRPDLGLVRCKYAEELGCGVKK